MADRSRQTYPATCSSCGNDTRVPFVPTPGKPVYCRECHSARKSAGGGGYGSRPRYYVTCNNCLQSFQVPFEPDPTRPIYCQPCRDEHRANQEARRYGLLAHNTRRADSVSYGRGMTTTRSDVWEVNLGHGIRVNKGGRRGPYGF
jgi:CxxC-x17-CxxC domain-containing protein